MDCKKEIGFADIQAGDSLPECHIKMDRETYFAYNKLINELNPLHFDAEYARKLGFKDIVVAGVYTFSFIPKIIEDWAGEAAVIRSVDIAYHNPVYLGETIVQKARVQKKFVQDEAKFVECEVLVSDSEGNRLTRAVVTVTFP